MVDLILGWGSWRIKSKITVKTTLHEERDEVHNSLFGGTKQMGLIFFF